MASASEIWFSPVRRLYFSDSVALMATWTPEMRWVPSQTGLQEPSPMVFSIEY